MRIAIAGLLLAVVSMNPLSSVLAAQQEPAAPPAAPEPAAAIKDASAAASDTASASATATATPASAAPDSTKKKVSPSDSAVQIALKAGDEDAADELKQLIAHGYKGEAHGSEIWFCRKEVLMGSRFDKKVCFTPDQLKHIAADAQQQTDRIQRRISGDPRTHNP